MSPAIGNAVPTAGAGRLRSAQPQAEYPATYSPGRIGGQAVPMPSTADRNRALDLLPGSYGRAIRLRDGGLSDAEIADRLEIEPESIGPLLEIAEAKLATAMITDPPPI